LLQEGKRGADSAPAVRTNTILCHSSRDSSSRNERGRERSSVLNTTTLLQHSGHSPEPTSDITCSGCMSRGEAEHTSYSAAAAVNVRLLRSRTDSETLSLQDTVLWSNSGTCLPSPYAQRRNRRAMAKVCRSVKTPLTPSQEGEHIHTQLLYLLYALALCSEWRMGIL